MNYRLVICQPYAQHSTRGWGIRQESFSDKTLEALQCSSAPLSSA